MPTISLIDINLEGTVHVHEEDDVTNQITSTGLSFSTSVEYIPGTLLAIYNGVVYTVGNDFEETGPNSITFKTGLPNDPFPPDPNFPLVLHYRKKM